MFLNIVSTFKGEGISQANAKLGAFGKQTSAFGKVLGKVGAAIASFGIAAKSIQFSKEAIEQARDLERNLFALDVIFGDLAPQMRAFTKNAENMGLSESKAAKASTFLGSVLKQSGFEMEDVVEKSQQLVSLGTDLAATYGYDVQEALLGMTALFRGEYDPIEKFGVAMKQAEVNAVLAERGLDKLTGAQLRNAEQTVRYEILIQRSTDAIGAFAAQTGSLFAEQKKLGASFENLQARLGTELLPVVVLVVEELRELLVEITPGLIVFFQRFGEVLAVVVGFFKDAVDPTTDLGEGFTALNIQIESLLGTLQSDPTALADFLDFVFDFPSLEELIELFEALLLVFENTVIAAKVLSEQIGVLFTGDLGKLLGRLEMLDEITKRIDLATGIKEFKLETQTATAAMKNLKASVAKVDEQKLLRLREQVNGVSISSREAANELRRMREQAGLPPVVPTVDTGDGGGGGGGGGGGSKAAVKKALDPVKELTKGLLFEGRKAELQGQLVGTKLTRGLVDQILTGSKPVVSAGKILTSLLKKDGSVRVKAVNKLNRDFAATYSEVNRVASEAAAEADAINQAAAQAREAVRQAELADLAEKQRVYESFLDAIKGTFAGIRNVIMGAFDITGLGGSTNAILRNMDKLLVRLRSFSTNVKQLATMGLDPALLQQVITMGPMAGARLATALVQGGAGALGAINAGFGEFGSLAGQIATTGTQSLFDRDVQRTAYTINVNGGVGSGATIGKAIVDAITAYERTSGAVFQPA